MSLTGKEKVVDINLNKKEIHQNSIIKELCKKINILEEENKSLKNENKNIKEELKAIRNELSYCMELLLFLIILESIFTKFFSSLFISINLLISSSFFFAIF